LLIKDDPSADTTRNRVILLSWDGDDTRLNSHRGLQVSPGILIYAATIVFATALMLLALYAAANVGVMKLS
jgi:hypothetical protein